MNAVSFITEYPVDPQVGNDTDATLNPMENRVFSTDDMEGSKEVGTSVGLTPFGLTPVSSDQIKGKGAKSGPKKRVQYAVHQRYSDLEILENEEKSNEDEQERMKLMKTLPPKYSDDSDIRNNIICTNNNIYIYAENKNGRLNDDACISVTDDNRIIYCSTKGRRYTIGGYANIGKRLNDEYHFFEEPMSSFQSQNTLNYAPLNEYDSFHEATSFSSLKYRESKNYSNMSGTMNQSHCGSEGGFNSFQNLLGESGESNRSTHDGHGNGLTRKFSVQKLFHDYKTYTQNVEHDQRTCKPCAHVYNGSICMNGDRCAFCHHSDHVLISAKKWKKLVKNNLEKLNIILHILRNPEDPNNEMLKDLIKPSPNYYQTKRISPRNFNGSNMKTMNVNLHPSHNMNMRGNTHANVHTNMHTNPVTPTMDYYMPKKTRNNRYMLHSRNLETMGRYANHLDHSVDTSPIKGMYHPPHYNNRRYPVHRNFNVPAYNLNVNK